MVAKLMEEQEREWLSLYSQIRALLQQYGKKMMAPTRKTICWSVTI